MFQTLTPGEGKVVSFGFEGYNQHHSIVPAVRRFLLEWIEIPLYLSKFTLRGPFLTLESRKKSSFYSGPDTKASLFPLELSGHSFQWPGH